MSAQHIYDTAPLGALIRYSNGEPQPPARFKRKVRAWEHFNGVGRLTQKQPGSAGRHYVLPASITLHVGSYGENGCIVLELSRSFHVGSDLTFTVAELPPVGAARVVTSWQEVDELRHLARDVAAAEAWLREHQYSNARIEVCISDTGEFAPAMGAAA